MITFIYPSALIWLLLAIPLVAFYLWRLRPRRYEVATGALWQKTLPIIHPRRAWQMWRWPVSLAIQLTILVTLVLALAEPCWRRPQRVAVVLDMTSSMSVLDTDGKTRLETAREKLLNLVENLGYNDHLSLITVSDSIQIISRMTNDREVIREALEKLPPVGGNASVAEAVLTAKSVVTAASDGKYDPKTQNVVLLSDGCFPLSAEVLPAEYVRWIAVGKSIANVEVENLAVARRNPEKPAEFETLVTLRNHSPREIFCVITLEMDDRVFHEENVTLPANTENEGRFTRVIPGKEPGRKRIRAVFTPKNPEDDFLKEDNSLETVLLAAHGFRVTVVTAEEENPLLEKAFQDFPFITVKSVVVAEGENVPEPEKAAMIPASPTDRNGVWMTEIVVYDRVLPRNFGVETSRVPTMIFAPPRATYFWKRSAETRDYVLMPWTEGEKYHFNTAGIGFVGTNLLTPTPEAAKYAQTWLVSQSALEQGTKSEEENLAKSAKAVSTTELAWGFDFAGAKENEDSARMVLVSCDLSKSDWLLADDFPQFLLYALDWLSNTEPANFRLAHGIEPFWNEPDVPRDSNLNVPPPPEKAFRLPGEDVIPMWSILAVLLLAGVVVEWCFYQRRWVE